MRQSNTTKTVDGAVNMNSSESLKQRLRAHEEQISKDERRKLELPTLMVEAEIGGDRATLDRLQDEEGQIYKRLDRASATTAAYNEKIRAAVRAEEVAADEADRERASVLSDRVQRRVRDLAQVAAPLVALLGEARDLDLEIEAINRRRRERSIKFELPKPEFALTSVEHNWPAGAPWPHPVWFATRILGADLKSWTWRIENDGTRVIPIARAS